MKAKNSRKRSRATIFKARPSIFGYHITDHCLKQMEIRGIDEMLLSYCLAKGRPKRTDRRKAGILALSLDLAQLKDAIHSGCACAQRLAAAFEFVVVTKDKLLITAYLRWGDCGIGARPIPKRPPR